MERPGRCDNDIETAAAAAEARRQRELGFRCRYGSMMRFGAREMSSYGKRNAFVHGALAVRI